MKNEKNSGSGLKFLRDNVAYAGEDCLRWPLHVNRSTGYGYFGMHLDGRKRILRAHRYMCELTNGPAPTPKHHAAHSCGNRWCVNPLHLSWKTSSENELDKRSHGTIPFNYWGRGGKITQNDAKKIRSLADHMTGAAIAKMFDLDPSHVSRIIHGKHWPEAA